MPQRIVSLAPNLTEIVFAVGAGERLVGATTFCNYPPEAARIPKVGGYMNPNMEVLLGLKPDLVLIAKEGTTKQFAQALDRAHIRVVAIGADTVDEVLAAIRQVGEAVGCKAEAEKLSANLADRATKVRKACSTLPRVKALLVYGLEPQIVVAGKGSFGDDLITAAGGINVASDSRKRYPVYNIEEIIQRAPEVILDTSMKPGAPDTSGWSRWPAIPAVKNSQVVPIDGDLITRAGPRLFDALEQVAQVLHPQEITAEKLKR